MQICLPSKTDNALVNVNPAERGKRNHNVNTVEDELVLGCALLPTKSEIKNH